MDSKKSNKIAEIVHIQQMLKRWKKLSATPKSSSKGIKFLKRTLSFADPSSAHSGDVPKGYLAVCVGEEMQRFVIPTEYLGHQAFAILLREAEEEFGFQQQGVLRLPCDVSVFESLLSTVENKDSFSYSFSEGDFDY
ncbi:auxin-induced protein 15A-like [Typha angustifolia]|uniref:auxin-induced protein 15A-like n=1 Tax=Typha angustifolia TaxID=59011 RepID=UPI003C2F0B8C